MNNIFKGLLIITFLGLCFLLYKEFNRPKYAYVDTARLLENYKGMKKAKAEFQKKASVWQANVDTLQKEVIDLLKDYEKKSSKLSTSSRKQFEEKIQNKQNQLIAYKKAITEKSKKEDMKMTKEVVDQVNLFFKKFGKDKGYTLIFGATQMGNIVYANEAVNLTDEAIELLNKTY